MDSVARVEQQRQALEQNLQKLRQSLKYWQIFEAEYEGLKEELLDARPAVDTAKLTEISTTYNGDLVTETVVRELAGLDKPGSTTPRSAPQIVRDIERRQEYVQRNIETIQRRFFEAEAKLEEFDFAATRDSETGLPLTEIEEELDDDDNVISSRVSQPEQAQSKLMESLRKAGLSKEDLEGEEEKGELHLKSAITNASPPIPSTLAQASVVEKRAKSTGELPAPSGDSTVDEYIPERPQIRKKSVSFTADTKAAPEIVRFESDDGKKCVSFADKVAIAPAAPPPDTRTVQFSPQIEEIPAQALGPTSPDVAAAKLGAVDSQAYSEHQKELRASFKPGDRVKTIGDGDEVVTEDIVLPEGESEEDAQARREMLDYHLHEVGHVVAEMDLDAGDDYDDDDDDDDDDMSSHFTGSTSYQGDEDTPYTSGLSDEEDEDEHGRTKHKVISDNYRKQMLEMQQRLIGNMGPAPKEADVVDVDPELDPQDVRKLVIRDKRSSTSSASSDSSEKKAAGKKRVSFAEELDVAEPGSPPLKAQKHAEGQNVAPVVDKVAERATSTASPALPTQGTPAKASRLKKTRATPPTESAVESPAERTLSLNDSGADMDLDSPQGPPGKILADTLIERPTSGKASTSAPSADDDHVAERRQLAAEYYRRRNEMVRQQGGFKIDRDEDDEMGELMEERDGKLKTVSRFKAARIRP